MYLTRIETLDPITVSLTAWTSRTVVSEHVTASSYSSPTFTWPSGPDWTVGGVIGAPAITQSGGGQYPDLTGDAYYGYCSFGVYSRSMDHMLSDGYFTASYGGEIVSLQALFPGGWGTVYPNTWPYWPHAVATDFPDPQPSPYYIDQSIPPTMRVDLGPHYTVGDYLQGVPDGTVTRSGTITITIVRCAYVFSVYPPSSGSDVYSAFGLDADRTVWDQTRIVHNSGFNLPALVYRYSNDNEATWGTVALTGLSGQSPSIMCLDDNTAFIAYSDATNIQIKRITDAGGVVETMPSPGPGQLATIYRSHSDPDSPVWVAFCTVSSGTGALKVYKTHDSYALTGWEAAVEVVASAPAQKPTLIGDLSELQLIYHDAIGTKIRVSHDAGATWQDG